MSGESTESGLHPAEQFPGALQPRLFFSRFSRIPPPDFSTESSDSRWLYAALGLSAAFYFYLHLWHFPNIVIWFGVDQAVYLEHAERMLRGEVLYRDLFQFNLPGTEYLYYFLFRLFGVHLWICAAALLVALTSITLAIYSLSRTVLRGAAALVPASVFLIICQRSLIDGSHHWYSTLCVLLAINLIARARNLAAIASAGVLLGVAALFTSSRGVSVAIGISLFFIWSSREDLRKAVAPLAALLAPFVTVVVVTFLYLGSKAGFRVLIDSLFVFPLRYYKSGAGNSYSWFVQIWHYMLPFRRHSILVFILLIFIIAAVPIVLIAFSVGRSRRNASALRDPHRERILGLCAFAGASAALAVANAPSATRLTCAAAFVYILAAVMLHEVGLRRFFAVVLLLSTAVALTDTIAAQVRPSNAIDGNRGHFVMIELERSQRFVWVAQHARSGDGAFGDINVNFVLGLNNPAKIPWVEPDDYTRPEQVRDLVNALQEKHTRFVLWRDTSAHWRGPGDNLDPLRSYLKEHYHLAQRFENGDQVLTNDATGQSDSQ